MGAKVTRNDVAKLAGVSPAVVSYVLNNSNYVSDEKRKAVLEAARVLNYSPNRFAQGLRTNRSFSIALIGDSLQSELFATLAVRLFNMDYYSSLFYAQRSDSFIRRIMSGRFDAVFMTSNGFSSQQLNRIVDGGTPVILYRSRDYEGLSARIVSMAPDFYDGVCQAMRHLVKRGHKKIAYIPPLHYQTQGLGGNDFRIRAYEDMLRANGLPENPAYVCTSTESMSAIETEVTWMMRVLPADQRPTAFLVGEDDIAAQLMQHLRLLDVRIPEEVSVVGWGNVSSARITTPQITTIDAGVEDFAVNIADALRLIASGGQPQARTFPVRLVVRGSA
ncbi:MAG: LacI family transcriptional regulator [Lachnospiraceae bacterium]|nr:LacI family transcriptional regulator [Lachnospiraceae bacterium]